MVNEQRVLNARLNIVLINGKWEGIMAVAAKATGVGASKEVVESLIDLANATEQKLIEARREYGRALLGHPEKTNEPEDSNGNKDNSIPASAQGMERTIHTFGNISESPGDRLPVESDVRDSDIAGETKD